MSHLPLLVSILLAGCSLTTSVTMKCKGECELDMGREVSADSPIKKTVENLIKEKQ